MTYLEVLQIKYGKISYDKFYKNKPMVVNNFLTWSKRAIIIESYNKIKRKHTSGYGWQ